MRIKEITWRNRRDFKAIYKCEHCEETHNGSGYDDAYFHNNVIPDMKCSHCGEKAREDYEPMATRFSDGEVV